MYIFHLNKVGNKSLTFLLQVSIYIFNWTYNKKIITIFNIFLINAFCKVNSYIKLFLFWEFKQLCNFKQSRELKNFILLLGAYFFLICLSHFNRAGGSLPVVFSYFSEFMPNKHRGKMISGLATFWMAGNIVAAGI